jgi:hypothetical protein
MSTIRFLRTFVAVAEHGSFAAAAGQVALTQAAVSLQMRSLEEELRRELFDRSGRVAVLNADGRELLPMARRLLDLYEEMRLPLSGSDAMAGAVAVGAVVSVMGGCRMSWRGSSARTRRLMSGSSARSRSNWRRWWRAASSTRRFWSKAWRAHPGCCAGRPL